MSKHILVISQYFYPEQFRINDICQEWVKKGYKVTVVTGIPNYPEGKFYPGYGWFKKRKETWNGIDIIRLPITARGKNKVSLAFNYLSFVVCGWFWKLFTKIKPDEVFIYEVSPMTQALVGVWLAKRRKIPCYLYVTDLWPENFEIITGIHTKCIIGPLEKMVKGIYKKSDKIFVSSQGFVSSVQSRVDDKDKIIYWPQYAEEFYQVRTMDEVTPEHLHIRKEGKFHLLFAGNIGEAQGLSTLVQVAEILKEKNEQNVLFCIVGDGRYKQTLIKETQEKGVEDYFAFYDRQPASEVPYLFAQVDASLICLSKSEVFALTVPAKTQSCLACGKPVLVCADGEVQNVIEEAACGLSADAEDAKTLADNIQKLMSLSAEELAQMSKNAISYSKSHFDKQTLLAQMDEYLQ